MSDTKYNLCACMGEMYGEPYCPCEMESRGLKEVMDNNPLRIEDNKRFSEDMEKWLTKMREKQ